MDVLDSRWVQSELGKSSSRSRGDATGITLPLSTPLDPKVHHADLAWRRKGCLQQWRSAYEDQAAKTAWKRKNSSCTDALVCSSGDSLRGISQSASQSDADQWLKAWMLYLWLADPVGVYGAVHVDCGAVLLSQNLNGLPDSILNDVDIRMLTMSMPECQV